MAPLAAQQPSAHWSFDGAAAADRVKESYGRTVLDAVETGGTSAWTTRAGFGEVLANGVNAPYLAVANNSAVDPGTGGFTLALWVYRTSDDAAAAGLLDALSASAGSGFQIFYQANGTLRIRLDDTAGNTVNADTSASQLALNAWRHLAVTVDRTAGRARFFVNGAEAAPLGGVDISAVTGAITPDQAFWIGTLNASNACKGRLDDVAMFKRVLSSAEIASLNANGGTPVLSVWPAVPPPPPVAISPPSGVLRDGETVTLTASSGQIRYTTDGSDPVADSPLYSAPFSLSASAAVKARTFSGSDSGAVSTAYFARIPAQRPNVVVIVADDLGFNDLGCYGAATVATPRLDAMARGGQRFIQFTTAGPGNLASQYAMLTGRLARRSGLPETVSPGVSGMDTREWTLAETYRKAGYRTGFIGAWHLGTIGGARPSDQGFVSVRETPGTLAELTAAAADFISGNAAEPFFLLFQPPTQAAGGSSLLGSYGNRLEALDGAVGTLLDELSAHALTERTMVVFLSDGGAARNTGAYPTGSNGQLRDGAGTTWEGGVRVPMIVSWPGVVPAGDNFSVLWLPDLLPSLAAVADAWTAADRPLDGTSRAEVLLGARTRPDAATTLYLHRNSGSAWQLRALRQGSWKLHQAYNNSDPGNTNPGTNTPFNLAAPLLFDLQADPIEHINRSTTLPSVTASLQSLATAHEATFAAPVPQLPAAKPVWTSPISSITGGTGQGSVVFTYIRPADSLDDYYVIQHSGDLSEWQDLASGPFVTSRVENPDGTETVTLTVPLDRPEFAGERRFLRLKANRP